MKQLLNTLYITTQGAYLAKDGETVLVRVEEESRLRVPIHTLASIVCFGRVSCSPALMGLCAESGVALSFLTENGRFLARVEGPVSGNVLLRREQYRRGGNNGEDGGDRAFGGDCEGGQLPDGVAAGGAGEAGRSGMRGFGGGGAAAIAAGRDASATAGAGHGARARGGRGASVFRSVRSFDRG